MCRYSHFRETDTGDCFDLHCVADFAVENYCPVRPAAAPRVSPTHPAELFAKFQAGIHAGAGGAVFKRDVGKRKHEEHVNRRTD